MPHQSFTFSGVCRLTCLYGQVEVFGFTLSQGQPAREVFSACTHSYLTINALHYSMPERSRKEMKKEARIALRSHLSLGKESGPVRGPTSWQEGPGLADARWSGQYAGCLTDFLPFYAREHSSYLTWMASCNRLADIILDLKKQLL